MKVQVIAHPNSKKPRIDTDLLGNLHVYVNAPAQEGKANMEITLAVAKHFKVKNYQVQLENGHKSKNKVFSINSEQGNSHAKN